MNGFAAAPVRIRPMVRADVDALSTWPRHDDPRFRAYDVGPLSRSEGDVLWRALSEPTDLRRPYVAELHGNIVGQLLLRDIDLAARTAELGIMLNPSLIGKGLGRRILRTFAGYCSGEGFQRLTLEVEAENERALRAYRAAGFVARGERRDPGPPPARIIRMETSLRDEPLSSSRPGRGHLPNA